MFRRILILLALPLVALSLSILAPAQAATLLSNISESNDKGTTGVRTNYWLAYKFTAGGEGTIDTFTLGVDGSAVEISALNEHHNVTIRFYQDSSGKPGTQLSGSLTYSSYTTNKAVYTGSNISIPSAGTYWVGISSSSAGSTIITRTSSSSYTGVASWQTIVDATTISESTDSGSSWGNAFSGITQGIAMFTIGGSVDTTGPTMTITAAEVSDGDTSTDSTLSLTFTSNEATSDFAVGDITVSNATISDFSATSSTVYTATLTPSAEGAVTVDVATGAFKDAASNDNTAATQFNWTYLSSATAKPDVSSVTKFAASNAAEWTQQTFNAIGNRLSWMGRNQHTNQTSYQGIKLHFENQVVDAIFNADPRSKSAIVNQAGVQLLNHVAGSRVATADHLKSDVSDVAVNEVARLREKFIGSFNPAFDKVAGDWSMWTGGEISVGKTKASSNSSAQEFDGKAISLGFDRPTENGGLLGFSLSLGRGDVDVGSSATHVDSDNTSLSSYTSFTQNNGAVIETIAGVANMAFDITRKDGSNTLVGSRDANQIFAAVTLKNDVIKRDYWSIAPYGKLSLIHTRLKGYSESGGSSALTFTKQEVNHAKLHFGADMDYLIPINKGKVQPFANVELALDSADSTNASMYYNSATTTNYQLDTDDGSSVHWQLGFGATITTEDDLKGSIAYRRNQAINSGYSNTLSFDLRFKF